MANLSQIALASCSRMSGVPPHVYDEEFKTIQALLGLEPKVLISFSDLLNCLSCVFID